MGRAGVEENPFAPGGGCVVSRPELDLLSEPNARVAPRLLVMVALPFWPTFLPSLRAEDAGLSSSLSGKSLESASSTTALFEDRRTGADDRIVSGIAPAREAGSSSSLESKRLLKVGRSSSSSLESANRLERGPDAFSLAFEPPGGPRLPIRRLLVRGVEVASNELRIEVLILV